MIHDTQWLHPYAEAMARGEPHLILTLETKEPIELGAFVGAFTSLANEYDRFIKKTDPTLVGDPVMFVREVRAGSIVADLLPWLSYAVPFIDTMDKMLIVEQFVRVWGSRFAALTSETATPEPLSRTELGDWADAVKAIASDPDASSKIEAATFEDGERKIKAAFSFSTSQAREAQMAIEARRRVAESPERADRVRVLMRFTRSDIGDVTPGRHSGERVIIEEISDRSLALVYGSELAEQRIKHEIREADENVYKKGFLVDVNVRMSASGKPGAYAVTNVHQVVDLGD